MGKMFRRSFLAALSPGVWRVAAQSTFTQQLWASIDGIYKKTLTHPFLTGLVDGTLAEDKFRVYLIQDSLYLRAFAQALGVLSSKAPNEEWAVALAQDALDARKEAKTLHEKILLSYFRDAAGSATRHDDAYLPGLCQPPVGERAPVELR